MLNEMSKFFEIYPGTQLYSDPRSSVRYGNTYRLDKAKEQVSHLPVDINIIVSHVNDFLKAIGINTIKSPIIRQPQKIDYKKIKEEYSLANERDIVWMKFTTDGYLGVVAVSNDINFDIPLNTSEYTDQKRNTAGILIHQLGKEWDTSFVLVFPLANIPAGKERGDIERAIGNYLIDKGVPIIDFYSHNY